MSKKLRHPSEYAQFSFRIDESDKLELNQLLEEILEIQRERKKEDEYSPKKNELIVNALHIGLTAIKKELTR